MRLPFRRSRLQRSLWAVGLIATAGMAETPYGLDARAPIGPYLNNVLPPSPDGFPFPPTLSATGAFRNLETLEPADGLVPFTVNSPLWTDGALKSRWVALPNDGPPYGPGEQISFTPVGEWSFPEGTVFVKEFDLTVNEATGERRRLETRFLVRTAEGRYGITYKWRLDQSDADLLPDGLEEDVPITTTSGATRIQKYSYPSRADCLFCHNQTANYVLGLKTHQLNGDFTYSATGRVDNQLRTLNHLGMLNPAQSESSFATYLRSVAISNPTAPVQDRMRSWIDANCSHCHRPGGFGPGYDGRFYTPLENQNLINTYVRFRDLRRSQLYQRDNSLGDLKMPPLAKNVIHETAMANLRQWIGSPLEVLSIHLRGDAQHLAVRFNSRVDPTTAVVASSYALDQGAVVLGAMMSGEPDTVILTVSELVPDQNYALTVSDIRDTAPSANTIWPKSRKAFAAMGLAAPTGARLANISTRVHVGRSHEVLIGGFIAKGTSPKRVLLRALGPSLEIKGVSAALADPQIELFDGNGVSIAANDDWEGNINRQEIADTGLAPLSKGESALVITLPASTSTSPYTAVVRGRDDGSGVALLEVYDLDRTAGSNLVNISARGMVQKGDDAIIGGFIVPGAARQKVIVRALGPSLPLDTKLPDPRLELHDADGALIQSNDNWRESQATEIAATGIPPSDERESAIVTMLAPQAYTAVVRGVGSVTGVALVEVFAVE